MQIYQKQKHFHDRRSILQHILYSRSKSCHDLVVEKYVMKPFNDEMSLDAKIMVNQAADAMQSIINKGLNITMNQFNS